MGVRWLSRQCSVVLYEFSTAADENPDVIGWAPRGGFCCHRMQVDSFGFLERRNEGCPETSACRNGPAPLLSVSTGCDPSEGPPSEVGTALGHQGPGDGRARGAGTLREKPGGRGPFLAFDAQARPN